MRSNPRHVAGVRGGTCFWPSGCAESGRPAWKAGRAGGRCAALRYISCHFIVRGALTVNAQRFAQRCPQPAAPQAQQAECQRRKKRHYHRDIARVAASVSRCSLRLSHPSASSPPNAQAADLPPSIRLSLPPSSLLMVCFTVLVGGRKGRIDPSLSAILRPAPASPPSVYPPLKGK